MWNLGLIHTGYEKHVLNSWKDHIYILSLIVYRHIIFNPPDFAFFYCTNMSIYWHQH